MKEIIFPKNIRTLYNSFAVDDVEDKVARQKDKQRAALEKAKWETLKFPLTCLTTVVSTLTSVGKYSCYLKKEDELTDVSVSLSSTAYTVKKEHLCNCPEQPSTTPNPLNFVKFC